MSKYANNLGASLERALAGVPTAHPAQVAGYWANRDFWLAEFDHLLSVIDSFDARLQAMVGAFNEHAARTGYTHKRTHSSDTHYQAVADPTSPQERRQAAADARAALKLLADRALDTGVATSADYDQFVSRLKVSGR